jgi:hypothetical protein
MTTNDNRRATAEDIRSASMKEFKLLSGLTLQIRKVPYSAICEITENLPDVAVLGDRKATERAVDSISTARRMVMIEKMVVAGVFDPVFTIDGKNGTPRPSDLVRRDLTNLFDAIMKLSGVSEEAGAEIRPLSGTPASSK